MSGHRKLRGLMKEQGKTVRYLAKICGISEVSMTKRLQGILQFKAKEIYLICKDMGIPLSEAYIYFFAF